MASKYSVYSVTEAIPPKWKPGEDLAASAVVAVTFYLVLETQTEIFRAFKRRKGLYFWSIQLGILGTCLDNIGICLKYLARMTKLWPLTCLFILGGWTIHSTAQLLILYSRLHFVCRDPGIQRAVFWMIIVTFVLFQIPSWVVVWPGYAAIPRITSEWSPRDAIVERFNQLGYTLAEAFNSGVYIKSLLKLLKVKSTVRQRRVMLDLIYINVLVVALDILEMVLVWLNINGLSHPIQTFSYALKFRLEFAVLNQLMVVAARGLYKESFAERRYHHPSINDADPWGRPMRPNGSQPPQWSDEKSARHPEVTKKESMKEIHIPKPQSTHQQNDPVGKIDQDLPGPPLKHDSHLSHPVNSHSKAHAAGTQSFDGTEMNDSLSANINLPTQDTDDRILESTYRYSLLNAINSFRTGSHRRRTRNLSDGQSKPLTVRAKNGVPSQDVANYCDEEGEFALHMWERRGEIVLQVPWLRSTDDLDI